MSDPNDSTEDRPDADLIEEDGDFYDSADTAEAGDLQNDIEQLRDENRQLYEKLARAQADYQNSQRRLEKDADQRLKIAAGHLVREFLPVVDNLERAMTVPESADLQTVVAGIRGTYDQWMGVLKANGVEIIEPSPGDVFDPDRHAALMQEPVTPAPETTQITRLLQKGYTFDGRVLRPAQVAVSRPG